MLPDPLHPVQAICICNKEVLEVVYKNDKSNQLDNSKRSVLAAFTTCLAHLKLYKSLEMLKEQVLYYDMDSVIYRCKPDEPTIPLGDYLGDMTDELENQGYITEFVRRAEELWLHHLH